MPTDKLVEYTYLAKGGTAKRVLAKDADDARALVSNLFEHESELTEIYVSNGAGEAFVVERPTSEAAATTTPEKSLSEFFLRQRANEDATVMRAFGGGDRVGAAVARAMGVTQK